jgi:hypothetical protein
MSTGIFTDVPALLGVFAPKKKALLSFKTTVTIHQSISVTSQKT